MITHPNVKINLGLHILSRRPDGFHNLETLFVPYFGISDTLEIVPAEDGKFDIEIIKEGGVGWNPQSDLTVRAYELLRDEFGIPPVKIRLEKTSPVGAGLGGGSSDAAFALRMLSDLFVLKLDDALLASYAARLGSDCPFFIYNRPMLGRGRGDQLSPFDISSVLEGYEIRVIAPENISVSTAEAYSGIIPRERTHQDSLEAILAGGVNTWPNRLENDFEQSVFAKYPTLAEIKQSLYDEGAAYASLSGSGSALFALFASEGFTAGKAEGIVDFLGLA